MVSELRSFSVVGHCGAPLLNPLGNSLTSLRRAVEVGAQMLKVDVRRTRDDILILSRESFRLLDGEEVRLRDRSFSQWRLDEGEWGMALTTLDQAFALAAEAGVGLMLDFKDAGTEALLARTIRRSRFPLDSLLVTGASETSRRILHGLDPRIPLSHALDREAKHQLTPDFFMKLDTEAVTWHYRLLTKPLVDILHRRNMLVYAWTVDAPEDMRRMHHVCQVDGIITNSPDTLRAILG